MLVYFTPKYPLPVLPLPFRAGAGQRRFYFTETGNSPEEFPLFHFYQSLAYFTPKYVSILRKRGISRVDPWHSIIINWLLILRQSRNCAFALARLQFRRRRCVPQNQAMPDRSLREHFGTPESGAPPASRTTAETVRQGLVKPDPRAGRSRRFAGCLPAWA